MKRVCIYRVRPTDSKISSEKALVNIDNGIMGGTHWCAFYVKNNKSTYFDSFGCRPDKLLLKQLPEQIKNPNYKLQDISSRLSRSYCL